MACGSPPKPHLRPVAASRALGSQMPRCGEAHTQALEQVGLAELPVSRPRVSSFLVDLAHQWMSLPSGLHYKEEVLGTGRAADVGSTVAVNYTGRLLNGVVFDSSKWHARPIEFELGVGKVIPGWDEGIEGMRVGGQRRLRIPADLAYGQSRVGGLAGVESLC